MNQFNLENEPQFNSENITLQYIYLYLKTHENGHFELLKT